MKPRLPRRALLTALAALAGVVVALVLQTSGTAASFVATIGNSTNSAATIGYFTCKLAVVGESGTRAYLAYPLGETTGLLGAADASGNGRSGSYSLMGVGYAQPGPCPRDSPASRAVTLDGANGYAYGPGLPVSNPNPFSLEIWFRTTVAGGKLIGFGSSLLGASLTVDRHLYVDSAGRLEFGVNNGANRTVATPGTVTDGAWHHAVATLSPAGMALYLDGGLVASNAAVTTARNATGYWRIGYDTLTGWPSAPANASFTGSLAWASIYTYALSAAQVSSHDAAGR